MAKTAKKKMAKARLAMSADRINRSQRDLLARNVRNERRVLALSKQLRRLLGQRDMELQILRDAITIYRGEEPAAPNAPTRTDDSLEAAHG